MSSNWIFFLAAFFVVDTIVVAAIVTWTMKRKSDGVSNGAPPNNSFSGAPSSSFDSPFSSNTSSIGSDGEIRELLRRGQKIDAIKLYRQQTGVGLKEAKDAVDAIERQTSSFELPFNSSTTSVGSDGDIRELLRRGQKIDAIKIYRQRTGSGLKEAKEAVEAIERQM